jgi:hypothetical protein
MDWWHWRRAQHVLETWVLTLIGARPYHVAYKTGSGSYVNLRTREITVDPTMADGWGGDSLLPFVWRGRTVRTLAALQYRISRAMARHEAGHVLFTDDYAIAGELHAWLTNALEDGRMERLTGHYYAPARADFDALGTLLWQKKPLAPVHESSRADRLLNACLFWRWDCLRPGGVPSRWRWASDAERRCWDDQVRPRVEEAWHAPTAVRVAEIALELLGIIGLPQSAGTGGHQLMPSDLTIVVTEGGSSDSALGRGDDDQPLSSTAPMYDTRSAGSGARDNDEAIAGVIVDEDEPPVVDCDPSAGNLWMQPYAPLQREVGGLLRQLLKILVVPTPDVDVRPSETTGTFDARAHIRSRGDTPMLHKRVDDHDPAGLALVLLIDRTGSMGGSPNPIDWAAGGVPGPSFEQGRMPHARRAAILLDMACTAAEIPLCIGYAGNNGYTCHHPGGARSFALTSPVIWVRDWSTPRSAEGPRALLAGMYGDSGDECYSASLRLAQQQLTARPERTKVIIYLLDGRPTDEPADTVRQTVEHVRRAGTLVIGLFVGGQGEIRYLRDIFGADDTIGVEDIRHLPDRLGRILLRYARKR